MIRFGFLLSPPALWVPTLSDGAVNKDKSEPHHRVIRFGILLSPPELWVPTLSAGAGNRGRTCTPFGVRS